MALSLASCAGNRAEEVRGIDSFTPTAADTIAMLRQMGDAYADATNRPDSATLASILRLPDIRRRLAGIHICDRPRHHNQRRPQRALQHSLAR